MPPRMEPSGHTCASSEKTTGKLPYKCTNLEQFRWMDGDETGLSPIGAQLQCERNTRPERCGCLVGGGFKESTQHWAPGSGGGTIWRMFIHHFCRCFSTPRAVAFQDVVAPHLRWVYCIALCSASFLLIRLGPLGLIIWALWL